MTAATRSFEVRSHAVRVRAISKVTETSRYVMMKNEGLGLFLCSMGDKTARPRATHRPRAEEATET